MHFPEARVHPGCRYAARNEATSSSLCGLKCVDTPLLVCALLLFRFGEPSDVIEASLDATTFNQSVHGGSVPPTFAFHQITTDAAPILFTFIFRF